jgi:hypothetical protein
MKFQSENFKETDSLEDLGNNENKMDLRMQNGLHDPWQGPVAGACEQGNESSSATQGRVYLDQPSCEWLLKDSALQLLSGQTTELGLFARVTDIWYFGKSQCFTFITTKSVTDVLMDTFTDQ